MRRWLAVLLLVLLPAQFTWAKLAVYCAHESAPAAWHLGHHDQAHGHAQHGAEPADAGAADEAASSAPDLDCGHCHGQAAVMFAGFDKPLLETHALRFDRLMAPRRPAPTPHPPERPQWRCLA